MLRQQIAAPEQLLANVDWITAIREGNLNGMHDFSYPAGEPAQFAMPEVVVRGVGADNE